MKFMKSKIFLIALVTGTFMTIFFNSCQNELTYKQKQLKYYKAFSKLYGYVRWFHPSNETGEIDWNTFALYACKKLDSVDNDEQFTALMDELFKPIAPTYSIFKSTNKPKSINKPENVSDYVLTVWQHYGVYLGSNSNVYKSSRIGFLDEKQELDFSVSEEVEIKIKDKLVYKIAADVKTNLQKEAYACLGFSGYIGYDNYQKTFKITGSEWKRYEFIDTITGTIDYTDVYCSLVGEGSASFDNFRIFVLKNNKWKKIKTELNDFNSLDNTLIEEMISNKQYHKFEIIEEKNNKYLNISSTDEYIPGMIFENYPKFGENIIENITDELSCFIPLTLYVNRKFDPSDKLKKLKKELNTLALDSITHKEKSAQKASLIITWNVFQHFYPYFETISVDWEKKFDEHFNHILDIKTEYEFIEVLEKMIALIQDGHGFVYSKFDNNLFYVPVRTDWIENQIIITASNDSLIKKGDIIKKVDGEDAVKIFNDIKKRVSGSPELVNHRGINRYFEDTIDSEVKIELLRNNETIEITTKRTEKAYKRGHNRIPEFEYDEFKDLGDGLYYFKGNEELFQKHLDEFVNAKAIIFDFRGPILKSSRQLPIMKILGHIGSDTLKSARWNVPHIIYPNRNKMEFKEERWNVELRLPRIKAKIAFLTDPSCVSFGETVMAIIEYYKLGKIIGRKTASCNGNVNYIEMNDSLRIMWTGLKTIKHDSTQHNLIGIKNDIEINRTIKGVKENRDETLEKAIEEFSK